MSLLTSILANLRAHEVELRERGVVHVAVFGSVVRAEKREDSDVDVARRDRLRPHVRPSAEAQAVYAF